MKIEDKKAIVKNYNTNFTYFESFIENYSYIRNICAHYGNVYNIKLLKSQKVTKKYEKYNLSNYKLFTIVISLKQVTSPKAFSRFCDEFKVLINKYDKVELFRMGFPDNWEEILNL